MNSPNSFSCVINKDGTVLQVTGKVEEVIHPDCPVIETGTLFFDIDWSHFFTGSFHEHQAVQMLQTIHGSSILIHQVSIQCPSSNDQLKTISLMNLSDIFPFYSTKKATASSLLFKSASMQKIMAIIDKISDVNSTVLLLGESGVGKSAIAKLIHQKSTRSEFPFIAVNCSTLPESLIESELFGYEAGTFTGGKSKGKSGLFAAAHKGTIFLDEIADLPFNVQAKLLDVIQENRIRKVGSVHYEPIDVRIVAATNKDLSALVKEQLFREDLYYRINVIPLTLPPLRERKEIIPELTAHFIGVFNDKYGRNYAADRQTIQQFMNYSWPGNIRELENTIERLVVTNLSNADHTIPIESSKTKAFSQAEQEFPLRSFPSLKEAKEAFEKELILKTYHHFQNTYKTAAALKVDQSTISKKLKKYESESMRSDQREKND